MRKYVNFWSKLTSEKIWEEYTLIIQTIVPIIWPTLSDINSPIYVPSVFLHNFHGIIKYMEMVYLTGENTPMVSGMVGVTPGSLHGVCLIFK